MDRTLALMLVFFGGGLGCLVRYVTAPEPNNPFMVANILACLAIGVIYALTRHKVFTNIYIQSFITVGFLGGLSTFTPLATYAIVQAEETFILSFLLFIGYLSIFLALSLVSYIPTALYCQRVLHLQPVPSIMAIVRNKKSRAERRQEEQAKEASQQQYAAMVKELSLAKEMLEKLKAQTATLGELAKRSPQAAREYAKAKGKIAELQMTLQIQQARISQLDPLKGQAPEDLQAAPGFTDAAQSALERKQARNLANAIAESIEQGAQTQAKVASSNEEQISQEQVPQEQVQEVSTPVKEESAPKATAEPATEEASAVETEARKESKQTNPKSQASTQQKGNARKTNAGSKASSQRHSQDDRGKYPAKARSKGKRK